MITLHILLFFGSISKSFSLQSLYSEARQVRSLQGHEKALPFYQEILERNPNDMTAATRIASDSQGSERHNIFGKGGNKSQRLRFIQLLESFGWNTIADLIFSSNEIQATRAKSSSAPLFLQPLRAGTQSPPPPTCSLSACIQLLLLAVCIPTTICIKLLGNEFVELLQELGIAFVSDKNNLLVPYVHIFPVTVADKTIYVATDLHPNVLSLTTVGNDNNRSSSLVDNGAVMYIGPDSLALIDHWSSLMASNIKARDIIVDIGVGSGVQALSLIALSSGKPTVKCVDINQRALRFTKLNFEWNNFDEPTLLLGDINQPFGRIFESDDEPKPWKTLLSNSVTCIVSNPPFLPVPIHNPTILSRYGSFSSGGLTGEEFFESLVKLASEVLDRSDPSATLAVVSEFMNPQGDFDLRLSSWWGDGGPARALFFTNEQAISAATYAQRRADSGEETIEWEQHLHQQCINHISPGLLFMKRRGRTGHYETPRAGKKTDEETLVDMTHCLVPKTTEGSIWTPTNIYARSFTRQNILEFLHP